MAPTVPYGVGLARFLIDAEIEVIQPARAKYCAVMCGSGGWFLDQLAY